MWLGGWVRRRSPGCHSARPNADWPSPRALTGRPVVCRGAGGQQSIHVSFSSRTAGCAVLSGLCCPVPCATGPGHISALPFPGSPPLFSDARTPTVARVGGFCGPAFGPLCCAVYGAAWGAGVDQPSVHALIHNHSGDSLLLHSVTASTPVQPPPLPPDQDARITQWSPYLASTSIFDLAQCWAWQVVLGICFSALRGQPSVPGLDCEQIYPVRLTLCMGTTNHHIIA